VIPWTVNDAAVARRLTAMGVDALCGDDITIFAT
jgi:glycerophosphoryl diester phosphodiesterase